MPEIAELTKEEGQALDDALNSRIGILRRELENVGDPKVRMMYYTEINRIELIYNKIHACT